MVFSLRTPPSLQQPSCCKGSQLFNFLIEVCTWKIHIIGIIFINVTVLIPLAGPGLSEVEAHKVIFHPLTGLCISGKLGPLKLGPCSNSEGWEYTAQKVLSVKGRNSTCLQAEGEGKEAKLGNECSVWEIVSDSKLHLSSKINNASDVCLDVDSNNNIVTNACKCLSGDKTCDPASQWFKLVDSTRKSTWTYMDWTTCWGWSGKENFLETFEEHNN